VLADTLTLASRAKTRLHDGFRHPYRSMATALGARYSGIFCNREKLLASALAAGRARRASQRLPLDAVYEEAWTARCADIKQCTMEGEADHKSWRRGSACASSENATPWLHRTSPQQLQGWARGCRVRVTGFGVAGE